jgi:DNA-binding transcriptional LysR family regulator
VLFQNLTPEAQVKALNEGRIDIGFVILPLDAEGLVTERTGRIPLMLALPEGHRFARKRAVRLEDLRGEAYMLWPRELAPGYYDYLLSIFCRAGFGPPIPMEGGLPSDRTVLGMVAANLTIALVEPAMRQMGAQGVIFRPIVSPAFFIEKGFICRRGDHTPILGAFLDEMRQILQPEQELPRDSESLTTSPFKTAPLPSRARAVESRRSSALRLVSRSSTVRSKPKISGR